MSSRLSESGAAVCLWPSVCAKKLEAILKRAIPFGILDINLYRDDLTTISNRPMLRETLIDFDINDLSVVLVDDVLYTGRTIRAALDGIVDLGRPKKVQLAVLVDRGLRELPIQADYVGKHIQTSDDEIVEVRLEEEDQEERVVLLKRPQPAPVTEETGRRSKKPEWKTAAFQIDASLFGILNLILRPANSLIAAVPR